MRLSGSFVAGGAPRNVANGGIINNATFGDWPGKQGGEGRAISGAFRISGAFAIEVAGYPKQPGTRFFLENASDATQRVELAFARNAFLRWRAYRYQVPRLWRNRQVRLVVEHGVAMGKEEWVAFSLPHEISFWDPSRLVYSAGLIGALVFEFLLVLLPGLGVALWLSGGRKLGAPVALTIVLCGSGVAAFFTFFSYLPGALLGRMTAVSILAASLGVVIRFRHRVGPILGIEGVRVIGVWLLVSLLFASATVLFRNDDSAAGQAQLRFFRHLLPPDNVLPFYLAEKIYVAERFRPTFFQDIHSSDRPPLQTGFMLAQRGSWLKPEFQYQLMAVLLQASWFPALWVFLRRAGVRRGALLAALAVPGLSYFALVHDVFVWPKLLSAAYGLLALSCFGWFGGRPPERHDAVLGGIAAALAMLAHSGVAFTAIGFAIVALIRGAISLRWALRFAGAAGVLFLPWILYQRFFDPSGNALIKLHLAGVEDRNASLVSLLVKSYSTLGFSGWVATKWVNLKYLFWTPLMNGPTPRFSDAVLKASELSFFCVVPCLGLANIGLFARLGRLRRAQPVADKMVEVGLVSLVVWLLFMFAPESDNVHQGSFLTILLLFAALAMYTESFSRRAAAALIALQFIQFLFLALLAKPIIDSGGATISDTFPDLGLFLTFLGTLTVLTYFFVREWRCPGAFSR